MSDPTLSAKTRRVYTHLPIPDPNAPAPRSDPEEPREMPALVSVPYLYVQFQTGPIQEVGVNGCQLEDVLDVAIRRLEGFQDGPHSCNENALALVKLREARFWLGERTCRRAREGTEGTSQP